MSDNALADLFHTRGTTAVAEKIHAGLRHFKRFRKGHSEQTIEVPAHPNEKKALAWLNDRCQHMGLPGLVFKIAPDSKLPDPTAIDNSTITAKKWLRYAAGPGVALLATGYSLPHDGSFEFMRLLPALGVGATSVILEIQFAWPWLNNKFWKNVFKLGGDAFAPFTMWGVNYLYALALLFAGFGIAHAPTLFGGEVIPFATSSPLEALWSSLFYTLAMGQFQSDVAKEEERGSITANQRYGLETLGVVINNSARITKVVLPSAGLVVYLAWGGFFLLKTFPQALKTRIADRLEDRETFREIDSENAPKIGFFEKIALWLGRIPLVNLPRMQKN